MREPSSRVKIKPVSFQAPSHGKPILLYDVTSKGCQSYLELAREVTRRLGTGGRA